MVQDNVKGKRKCPAVGLCKAIWIQIVKIITVLIRMLSIEKGIELEVASNIPHRLMNPSFIEKKILWIKETKLPLVHQKDLPTKRYEYVKIGRTFGFDTTRYLAFAKNYLFYYDGETDKDYKGYCNIENVYMQWFQLKSGRFLLFLTNGNEQSFFYFNNPLFWKELKEEMAKCIIQLDFKEKYDIIGQIGKGSFSKVYHARNIQTKKQFAAKVINKRDKNKSCTKSLVLQQRKILRLINSPYVYKFQQLYEEQDSYVFIIQYLPGKDLMALYKEKKVNDPQIVMFLLRNILEGIRDIHRANVIHRDLKPQNILINLDTFKPYIIDFGLSLHVDEAVTTKSYKRCGTMGYMAPEVIQNTGQNKKAYGCKCDLFSFGIIAHMLLLGYNPLKGDNYQQTQARNKACDIDLDKKMIAGKYGEAAHVFLSKLLMRYPQLRYDSDAAIKSEFLREKDKSLEKDKQESNSTIEQKKKVLFQSTKSIK